MLPPLIDPWTGEQREFTWKPSSQRTESSNKQQRYGDAETTELLTRQYPPLFHAATNVSSFVQALSCFKNLQHLKISCAGSDGIKCQSNGTDVVRIALTSLRTAIEKAKHIRLQSLRLSHVHHADLMALSPLHSSARPDSAKRWSGIRVLDISMYCLSPSSAKEDQMKLLRECIRGFKGLRRLSLRWLGGRGISPLPAPRQNKENTHPALRTASHSTLFMPLFPHLENLAISNAIMSAGQVAQLIKAHKSTLVDLDNIILTGGSWQDVLGTPSGIDVKTTTLPGCGKS